MWSPYEAAEYFEADVPYFTVVLPRRWKLKDDIFLSESHCGCRHCRLCWWRHESAKGVWNNVSTRESILSVVHVQQAILYG